MTSEITEMPEDQLADAIGPTAMREYNAAADWDKPKIRTWIVRLRAMSDHEFVGECGSTILSSAIMQRFRGNHEGVHARASACHTEAERRHTAAGHDPDCHGDNLYDRGYRNAMRSQGHSTRPPAKCTCGKDGK